MARYWWGARIGTIYPSFQAGLGIAIFLAMFGYLLFFGILTIGTSLAIAGSFLGGLQMGLAIASVITGAIALYLSGGTPGQIAKNAVSLLIGIIVIIGLLTAFLPGFMISAAWAIGLSILSFGLAIWGLSQRREEEGDHDSWVDSPRWTADSYASALPAIC